MKLLMLKNASLPGLELQSGKVCDVPEPAASNLIKAGCARPAPSNSPLGRAATPQQAEVRLRRLREACVDCNMPEPVVRDIVKMASMLLAGATSPPVPDPSPNGKPPEPPRPAAPAKPPEPPKLDEPPPPDGEADSKPSDPPSADDAEGAAKPNEDPPPAPAPRKPNPRRPA